MALGPPIFSILCSSARIVGLGLLFILAGCADRTAGLLTLEQENQSLQRRLEQSDQTIADQQATITRQENQITTLSKLGEGKRLEELFTVEKIRLGRYTGGANLDDQPGDDGVKVYLVPQDQDGRTVTAAGSIKVEIFDLSEANQPLLAGYEFSPAQARKLWQSGALANHYSITCPWKDTPPSAEEITIRVEFVDYLTGKTFTATKQCRIRRPQP